MLRNDSYVAGCSAEAQKPQAQVHERPGRTNVGYAVISAVGSIVGSSVGKSVGTRVTHMVGAIVGSLVGMTGASVGSARQARLRMLQPTDGVAGNRRAS